jgi:hypothetical protein
VADEEPVLVDPALSQVKLARQIADFEAQADIYRSRGYWIVKQIDLDVYLAFAARVRLNLAAPAAPAITAYIRLRYNNFDLWAPSLAFLDFFSDQPTLPVVEARQYLDGQPRNLLLSPHPLTGLPFLCHRGVREYHTHPQHSGDAWALYRTETNLTTIADGIWQLMARNVVGLKIEWLAGIVQQNLGFNLIQADVDAQAAQLQLSPIIQQLVPIRLPQPPVQEDEPGA